MNTCCNEPLEYIISTLFCEERSSFISETRGLETTILVVVTKSRPHARYYPHERVRLHLLSGSAVLSRSGRTAMITAHKSICQWLTPPWQDVSEQIGRRFPDGFLTPQFSSYLKKNVSCFAGLPFAHWGNVNDDQRSSHWCENAQWSEETTQNLLCV